MKTEIFYEDGDIIVVYKPAGFAVQTAKPGQLDVVSELKNYLWQCRPQREHSQASSGGVPYLGIIHRLDQPVEGLLVFAKNKRTAASLSGQLQKQGDEGAFHKRYYAVLCGQPSGIEGELVNFLSKNKDNKAEVATGHGVSGAKRAVLRYSVMEIQHVRTMSAAEREQSTGSVLDIGREQYKGNVRNGEREQSIGSVQDAGREQSTGSVRDAGREQSTGSVQDAGGEQSTGSVQGAEGTQSIRSVRNAGNVPLEEGMRDIAGERDVVSAGDVIRLRQGEGAQLTLADIHIQTGRFHQIRVQMAHAGMPLLGDFKYGNEYSKALSQGLNIQNVALCAYSLAFLHPASNREMHFQIKPKGKAFSYFDGNKFVKESHTKR